VSSAGDGLPLVLIKNSESTRIGRLKEIRWLKSVAMTPVDTWKTHSLSV
jgi:hypothetical protein